MALRLPAVARGAARRKGVLAAVPACATVPVCCGAPLAALAGGTAAGMLLRFTPWLMAASLLLLGANAILLRQAVGSAPPGGASDPAVRGSAGTRPVAEGTPQGTR